VTVCATVSLFVQITVVFTETVSVAGLNAIPAMDTAVPPLPGVGAGDGVEYILEDLEQLTNMQKANILTGIKIKATVGNLLNVFI
jgi:hypothetical protein